MGQASDRIDVQRFVRDYCAIYLGASDAVVEVETSPTQTDPRHNPDPLTGEAPLETRITVHVKDQTVEADGIDLREALIETMAAVRALTIPGPPSLEAVIYTIGGEEVSEDNFGSGYPKQYRHLDVYGLMGLYPQLAHGMVGEFEVKLYSTSDPDIAPLLYAYGSDGQEQYHLLPAAVDDEPQVDAFTKAWTRGMSIVGRGYFHDASHHQVAYRSLAPYVDDIQKALPRLPASTAVFLAAMVSFFNGDTGGKMLRSLQAAGLSDIAARLDHDQRQVLADLMVAYTGW